jgi:hypothetical protein
MAKFRDLPDTVVNEPEVASEILTPQRTSAQRIGEVVGAIIVYTLALLALSTVVGLWYRYVLLGLILP